MRQNDLLSQTCLRRDICFLLGIQFFFPLKLKDSVGRFYKIHVNWAFYKSYLNQRSSEDEITVLLLPPATKAVLDHVITLYVIFNITWYDLVWIVGILFPALACCCHLQPLTCQETEKIQFFFVCGGFPQ